jgi:hypothetical protein
MDSRPHICEGCLEQSLVLTRKEHFMDATNGLHPGLKETARGAAPVATTTLSVNVFTAPGKPMVGERPKPFGEALRRGAGGRNDDGG